MFYYLYEIRNNINGKIYVGVHKTENLDDGYMGSGKVIQRAIKLYGAENFTKVILETFENAEAMYAREKEVVNEEFLEREDVYNLRRGGHGGFEYINKNGINYKGYESAAKRNAHISPMGKPIGNVIREMARNSWHELLKDETREAAWLNNVRNGKLSSDMGYVTSQMHTPEAILKKKTKATPKIRIKAIKVTKSKTAFPLLYLKIPFNIFKQIIQFISLS